LVELISSFFIIKLYDSDRRPVSNRRPILKSMSDFYVTDICTADLFSNSQIDVQWRHWRMLQITSHPLGQVFEAMMEKRQDQIPDDGFLMTKKRRQNGVSKGPNTSLCGYSVHCSKEY